MRTIRGFAALAMALALSGCVLGPSAATTDLPPDRPPLEEMRRAFSSLGTMPYRYEILHDGFTTNARGSFDDRNRSYTFEVFSKNFGGKPDDISTAYLGTATDLYLWDTGPRSATSTWPKDKWLHISMAKAPRFHGLTGGDVGRKGFVFWSEMIVTAERTGVHTYRGTFDLSKLSPRKAVLDPYPNGGRSIPFEASTDMAGRISQFRYTTPAFGTAKANTKTIWILDKGETLDVKPPTASQITEATEAQYKVLNDNS